jgi:hypothetical protein
VGGSFLNAQLSGGAKEYWFQLVLSEVGKAAHQHDRGERHLKADGLFLSIKILVGEQRPAHGELVN